MWEPISYLVEIPVGMSAENGSGSVNGGSETPIDYLGQLAKMTGRTWDHVLKARSDALAVQQLILESLSSHLGRFYSSDTDVVVFGSLARKEWTSGSDVDWTLLIDGQAIPQHRILAQEIARTLQDATFRDKRLRKPGTTGIFGTMAFSHDIIHHIGGQTDSNKNTTQRILLLLESTCIRSADGDRAASAYSRVINNVLARYLYDDTNFVATGLSGSRIPRFLLNDIVRYWRTMCVDFACKEWEQRRGKWALRNIKLRMSRKLLFVSGLLTVFSCFENPDLTPDFDPGNVEPYVREMQRHLAQYVLLTPLDILVSEFLRVSLKDEAADLLEIYDLFLQRLDDSQLREHLRTLPPKNAYKDARFLELRSLSHDFQEVLTRSFFDMDTPLRRFNIKYGVF